MEQNENKQQEQQFPVVRAVDFYKDNDPDNYKVQAYYLEAGWVFDVIDSLSNDFTQSIEPYRLEAVVRRALTAKLTETAKVNNEVIVGLRSDNGNLKAKIEDVEKRNSQLQHDNDTLKQTTVELNAQIEELKSKLAKPAEAPTPESIENAATEKECYQLAARLNYHLSASNLLAKDQTQINFQLRDQDYKVIHTIQDTSYTSAVRRLHDFLMTKLSQQCMN